jgi:hypothetical protein
MSAQGRQMTTPETRMEGLVGPGIGSSPRPGGMLSVKSCRAEKAPLVLIPEAVETAIALGYPFLGLRRRAGKNVPAATLRSGAHRSVRDIHLMTPRAAGGRGRGRFRDGAARLILDSSEVSVVEIKVSMRR